MPIAVPCLTQLLIDSRDSLYTGNNTSYAHPSNNNITEPLIIMSPVVSVALVSTVTLLPNVIEPKVITSLDVVDNVKCGKFIADIFKPGYRFNTETIQAQMLKTMVYFDTKRKSDTVLNRVAIGGSLSFEVSLDWNKRMEIRLPCLI